MQKKHAREGKRDIIMRTFQLKIETRTWCNAYILYDRHKNSSVHIFPFDIASEWVSECLCAPRRWEKKGNIKFVRVCGGIQREFANSRDEWCIQLLGLFDYTDSFAVSPFAHTERERETRQKGVSVCMCAWQRQMETETKMATFSNSNGQRTRITAHNGGLLTISKVSLVNKPQHNTAK